MAAVKKEKIKDQMVNTAARLWGVEESEIEQNFDPLLMLLIEACAAELENIGLSISESHTRLLDNLANLVLPESLFGAIPASGILHSAPIEDSLMLDEKNAFSLTQKIFRPATNSNETVDLYFSPAGKFTILKADLCYMMAGNKLFALKENKNKETVYAPEKAGNSNEIWLAIKFDKPPATLKGLNIYFDLRSHSVAGSFYNALAFSKCFANDQPVQNKSGLNQDENEDFEDSDILMSGNDRSNKLNRKIAHVYQHHFLQITDETNIKPGGIPESWKAKIPAEITKKLESEKLIYLKIELPQNFPQEIFDITACYINAFPAVNKKLNSFTYKTEEWLNIIPIPVSGTFFDLASVKNEKGASYKIRSGINAADLTAGEAIVRSSGVGRTSSQDVREKINNITESLRDQSAYYGQISNDVILTKLREIGKVLTGLEDTIKVATDRKPEFYYLMIRPQKNGEMIFIDYWTTNDIDANNIKAGTFVNAVNNAQINSKSSYVLSGFSGGKNDVSDSEKKAVLRQQLLSGGKIVSAEDVKLLCNKLFGDKLKSVEVKKGVQVGNKPGEGFNRTIDVLLTYGGNVNGAMADEMENLYYELEYTLQKNASPVYPFCIKITNPL